MNEAKADFSLEEPLIEERPSGDFIDGFLAGVATATAVLSAPEPVAFFYSFDWIGDGEEEREQALLAAFDSDSEQMSFDLAEARDWRADLQALGTKWLARKLPEPIVGEFNELMQTFFGVDEVEVFRVLPHASGERANLLGSDYDHLLFETPDGRLLLEFSVARAA
ncbi:MAG: hypothetical protein AAF661_07540 [Pseudomonadota bacterium]